MYNAEYNVLTIMISLLYRIYYGTMTLQAACSVFTYISMNQISSVLYILFIMLCTLHKADYVAYAICSVIKFCFSKVLIEQH